LAGRAGPTIYAGARSPDRTETLANHFQQLFRPAKQAVLLGRLCIAGARYGDETAATMAASDWMAGVGR
jgi:hypothetical protein